MKKAGDIVSNVCAYTNHTILAEALEKWPMDYLQEVVPQLMPIIEGLDYVVATAFNNNEELSIIDSQNRVHMLQVKYGSGSSHRRFFDRSLYRQDLDTNSISVRLSSSVPPSVLWYS